MITAVWKAQPIIKQLVSAFTQHDIYSLIDTCIERVHPQSPKGAAFYEECARLFIAFAVYNQIFQNLVHNESNEIANIAPKFLEAEKLYEKCAHLGPEAFKSLALCMSATKFENTQERDDSKTLFVYAKNIKVAASNMLKAMFDIAHSDRELIEKIRPAFKMMSATSTMEEAPIRPETYKQVLETQLTPRASAKQVFH